MEEKIMSNWGGYAIHKCGEYFWCGSGMYPHYFKDRICSECGEEGEWKVETARQVFAGVWYNPLTWFNFQLEVKRENE